MKRILFVDDEAEVLDGLRDMLAPLPSWHGLAEEAANELRGGGVKRVDRPTRQQVRV